MISSTCCCKLYTNNSSLPPQRNCTAGQVLTRSDPFNRIAATYRAKAAHGGLDVRDEVGLVRIAALGLGDEEVGRLEAGLEPDVPLTAEEGLVPPRLAHFHGLVNSFLSRDEGLFGFGAPGQEPGCRHARRRRSGGRNPCGSGGRSGGQHGSAASGNSSYLLCILCLLPIALFLVRPSCSARSYVRTSTYVPVVPTEKHRTMQFANCANITQQILRRFGGFGGREGARFSWRGVEQTDK